MSYVIFHKGTTRILRVHRKGHWQDAMYATKGAAKAALTRAAVDYIRKPAAVSNKEDYAIAEYDFFVKNIEKTEVVTNLMSGKPVRQSVNTPISCDVSSETYWSM